MPLATLRWLYLLKVDFTLICAHTDTSKAGTTNTRYQ